ncbi:hypothetical protein SLEP1_g20804 [Rubroshorea leprosula]|uniref:Uncharacterized protein n=1 Tax=Rubroshorea leprosula TaxID=152421 RepID=A0AAV5J3V6_9ROSI|nr:hypothetical protein SLEP1_g20804 [Rubroshorea leprosula]
MADNDDMFPEFPADLKIENIEFALKSQPLTVQNPPETGIIQSYGPDDDEEIEDDEDPDDEDAFSNNSSDDDSDDSDEKSVNEDIELEDAKTTAQDDQVLRGTSRNPAIGLCEEPRMMKRMEKRMAKRMVNMMKRMVKINSDIMMLKDEGEDEDKDEEKEEDEEIKINYV